MIVILSNPLWVGDGSRFPFGAIGYSEHSKGTLEPPAPLFCKAACRYSALQKVRTPPWPVWTLFHGIRGILHLNNNLRAVFVSGGRISWRRRRPFHPHLCLCRMAGEPFDQRQKVGAATLFKAVHDRFHRLKSTVASKAWIGDRDAKDCGHEIPNRWKTAKVATMVEIWTLVDLLGVPFPALHFSSRRRRPRYSRPPRPLCLRKWMALSTRVFFKGGEWIEAGTTLGKLADYRQVKDLRTTEASLGSKKFEIEQMKTTPSAEQIESGEASVESAKLTYGLRGDRARCSKNRSSPPAGFPSRNTRI